MSHLQLNPTSVAVPYFSRMTFCLVPSLRANLQSSTQSQAAAKDARPSMILRNGFISPKFLLCQLLLLFAVVAIRLHAAQPPQHSAVSLAPQVTATSDTGQRDTATEQI